ncbi:hypothetical protein AWM75_05480 [Aerococcus urinaehominis]|uniref:Uncharacterized protein n=1 Tax=Aerococcus urinaehominis TaxID=128944 RepID=A0A0X8FLG5_9LACT|nr:SEC-C metal-binding domain-containing protein [Aerococcus urinaehominis]AMB99479.1 hypothetical protein AWM75_05480 [Aerococcus urinaehominis]SDM27005.1 SEC-C motif-containing protein [Aerococcus urinaehominis]
MSQQEIFELYNSADQLDKERVVDTEWAALLNQYVLAAINLYDVIKVADLIGSYNDHHDSLLSVSTFKQAILPFILQEKNYFFFEDKLAHIYYLDLPQLIDRVIASQQAYPPYRPSLAEFLNYQDETYSDNPHQNRLVTFLNQDQGLARVDAKKLARLVQSDIIAREPVEESLSMLEVAGCDFSQGQALSQFSDIYRDLVDFERRFYWHGQRLNDIKANQVEVTTEGVGPSQLETSDPCPCGSGATFMQCCLPNMFNQTALLPESDIYLFYAMWLKLIAWINDHHHIVDASRQQILTKVGQDRHVYQIRQFMWAHPELILDYLASGEVQDQENRDILQSWYDHHLPGHFYLGRYSERAALFMGRDHQGQDRIFAVRNNGDNLGGFVGPAPLLVGTVLLPFKGEIIYDSIIGHPDQPGQDRAPGYDLNQFECLLAQGIITHFN